MTQQHPIAGTGPSPGVKQRTCVIIDDELLARLTLSGILERHFPEIRELGHARTVEQSVALIQAMRPDIVFLDIELIGGTAFAVLDRIAERPFVVVFTTAFNTYGNEIARFPDAHVLLKPVRIGDLRNVLKASERL